MWLPFGGSSRLDNARERHARLSAEYEELRRSLLSKHEQIQLFVIEMNSYFGKSKSTLRTAHRLIHPLQRSAASGKGKSEYADPERSPDYLIGSKLSTYLAKSDSVVATGAFAGTSAAIVAWQSVQFLGTASTGAAIGGLHGIAASNAGWAAFGGGSLATGGGGMALGHAVLPGIGSVVAVGVAAFLSHTKANECNEASDEIAAANAKNRESLVRVERLKMDLSAGRARFLDQDDILREAVFVAKQKLRRFGWFSVFRRYVRYKWKGYFYTSDEQAIADQLEREVSRFLGMFGVSEGCPTSRF